MAWMAVDGRGLMTGDRAAIFEIFFLSFRHLLETGGGSHESILQRLAVAGELADLATGDRDVIQAMAGRLLGDGVGTKVGTMRSPLAKVLLANGGTPLTLDWPFEAATSGSPAIDKLPIGLSLTSAQGIRYVLAPEDGRPTPIGSLLTSLTLQGDLAFNSKLSVPTVGLFGFDAEASAEASRRLTYLLSYDSDLVTWRAVTDGFQRVRRLDSFDAVLKSFETPAPVVASQGTQEPAGGALEEIRFTGGQGLMLRAGTTLRIPLANAGTLNGRAGGKLEIGGGFAITVRHRPAVGGTEPKPPALLLGAKTWESFELEGEVGVGYSLGVGDLTPGMAQSLLSAVVSSESILKEIDKFVGNGQSFLKPGTMLRDHLIDTIKEKASEESGGRALRILLGDVVGLDADGDIDSLAGTVGDLFASIIDGASTLFSGDLGQQMETLLTPISAQAEAGVKTALDGIAGAAAEQLNLLLLQASGGVDQRIRGAIAELLSRPPKNAVSDLRAFLDKARETLNEIASGVRNSGTDLVAAEIAWTMGKGKGALTGFDAEIEPEGRDFYRSVIWRPNTGAGRLIDAAVDPEIAPPKGVTAINAEEREALNRLQGRSWNVALIDAPASDGPLLDIAGSRRTFAEAKVERTLTGVSVGSTSWNKVRSDVGFLFNRDASSRQIELADALSFVNAEAADGSNVKTARLQLTYTWRERDFGPKEIRRFTRSFETCGLLGEEGAETLRDFWAQAKTSLDPEPSASIRTFLLVPPDFAARVIDFVTAERARAREAIERVVERPPFDEEHFSKGMIDSLLDYFFRLRQMQSEMMELPASAAAKHREALRERLAEQSKEAHRALRRADWVDAEGPISVAIGGPDEGLLALFACLAELTAVTPGCARPGMVFAFTAEGAATKTLISPRAGLMKSSEARLKALEVEEREDRVFFGLF